MPASTSKATKYIQRPCLCAGALNENRFTFWTDNAVKASIFSYFGHSFGGFPSHVMRVVRISPIVHINACDLGHPYKTF